MSQCEDWYLCFWCGETIWGYGKDEKQARFQARNNRIGHETTCDKNPDNRESN